MSNFQHGDWARRPNGRIGFTDIIPRILGFNEPGSPYNSPEVQLPVLSGNQGMFAEIYSPLYKANFGGQLLDSSQYCITNGELQISGKSKLRIQVGYWMVGRWRFNAPTNSFVSYDINQNLWNDQGIIYSHSESGQLINSDYTLLTSGRVCNIQDGAEQGRTFFLVKQVPSNPKAEGFALQSSAWSAISDGQGGVTWERY
jgi:hypothetical protein